MTKRKKVAARRCGMIHILNSKGTIGGLEGVFWFTLWPTRDPIAWKALQYYADITPNVVQRQALLKWLKEHPCPGAPVVEQMEMGL